MTASVLGKLSADGLTPASWIAVQTARSRSEAGTRAVVVSVASSKGTVRLDRRRGPGQNAAGHAPSPETG